MDPNMNPAPVPNPVPGADLPPNPVPSASPDMAQEMPAPAAAPVSPSAPAAGPVTPAVPGVPGVSAGPVDVNAILGGTPAPGAFDSTAGVAPGAAGVFQPPVNPAVGGGAPMNPMFNPVGGGLVGATDPITMPAPPKAPDPVEVELNAPFKAAAPVPGSIGSAISVPAGEMGRTPSVAFNDPAATANPAAGGQPQKKSFIDSLKGLFKKK